MKYIKIILPLIVSLLFLGCVKHPKKAQTDDSYKVFVNEMPENEIIMSSCNIICKDRNKKPVNFGNTRKFYEITKPVFTQTHEIIDSFIKYKRSTDITPKPYQISNYFLQYVGYSKDDKQYVYVNLSTFITCRTLKSGLVVMNDLHHELYLDKDAGYAGYIIVDINKKAVVGYKFEDNILE